MASNTSMEDFLSQMNGKDQNLVLDLMTKYEFTERKNNLKAKIVSDVKAECGDRDINSTKQSKILAELVKHRGYVSNRKITSLCFESIESDICKGCGCTLYCSAKLDPYTVLKWRKKVHMTVQGFSRQLRLFNIVKETLLQKDTATDKTPFLHIIEGLKICRNAFVKIVLRISMRSYFRTTAKIKQGIQYLVHSLPKKPKADRGCIALGFIASYVELMGDKCPDRERILLPIGMNTLELYKRYTLFYKEGERIKEKRFYQLFKDNFPNVSYQHGCGRFTKCNVCVAAQEILEQNHPVEIHEATRRKWDEHLLRQQQERQAYYKRRHAAIDHPKNKLSIILDGMDQSKTNIPHFSGWAPPKLCDGSKLLQTHINGAIVHGQSHYAIIDCHQWSHDSNLTLSCLLYCLAEESTDGKLPPNLYVQLDNCGRENKNRFFLGMMAYLVYQGYVEEVILSFLMVGHTHEDIDAGFSHIASKLRKNPAKSLPKLMHLIESSTSLGMKTVLLPAAFDIKEWLSPCLNDIHNQSFPHVYRFYKDTSDHVSLKYKHWSTDAEWLPASDHEQLEIFKVNAYGKQIVPEGFPNQSIPNISKRQELKDIHSNIVNLDTILRISDQEWWEEFLNDPHATLKCDIEDNKIECYLKKLITWHQSLNINVELNQSISDATPLDLYMDKENSRRKVYTGKRKAVENSDDNSKASKVTLTQEYMILFKDKDGDIGIGQVKEHIGSNLLVALFDGHLGGKWWQKENTDFLLVEKECILDGMIFQLTRSHCLPSRVKKSLKSIAKELY